MSQQHTHRGKESPADEVRAAISEAAHEAETAAQQALNAAKSRITEGALAYVDGKRAEMAGEVNALSRALDHTADALSDEGFGTAAVITSIGATQISKVADELGDLTFSNALDKASALSRERPALFYGGALAIGLLIGGLAQRSLQGHD